MSNIDKKHTKLKSIAIVTYGMRKGGSERVISLLSNYFAKLSVEVNIYTFINDNCEYDISNNVKLISLTEKKGSKYNNRDIIRRMIRLRKEIKIFKPDITLIMPEEISAIAVPTLIGLRTSIVVSERNNPWIMPQNKLKRILRFLFYRTVDGFVFQTNQAKSFFSTSIQNKATVIANPISVELKKYCYEGVRKNEIVAVSRLEKQKNIHLLIDAFSIFETNNPNFYLTIYGEGTLRTELQQKINYLSLEDKIKLPGKSENVFKSIRESGMFVMSSDFEGMPNALMEAMALGLPVISTDCPSGGPSELIENELNGILVPVKDKVALSDAMDRIAKSNEFANYIGKNAINIIEDLNPDKILKEWNKYLSQFVK